MEKDIRETFLYETVSEFINEYVRFRTIQNKIVAHSEYESNFNSKHDSITPRIIWIYIICGFTIERKWAYIKLETFEEILEERKYHWEKV